MQRKIVKTVQFENTEQDLQWRPLTKADQSFHLVASPKQQQLAAFDLAR